MADIVERLRCSCNCNIDTSPCGAEEECRAALEAADEIERLRAALSGVTQAAQLLYQNSLGCAVLHHGADFKENGIPGWLADAAKQIEVARAALEIDSPSDRV